jgi:hypothetical protein
MNAKTEFHHHVAALLREAGIPFEENATLGGIAPDFVVPAPDGRRILVELKAWEKSPGYTSRAANQVQLYEDAVGADDAFIVLEALQRSRAAEGVVTAEQLVPALLEAMERLGGQQRRRRRLPSAEDQPTIFAAMPFDPSYDDVFLVAMAHAARSIHAVCRRTDLIDYSGDVMSKVLALIDQSVAVIADLSEGKPNVLYEVGYAHALHKPTIHICSTPLGELPFDVSHWNTLTYRKGQTHSLRRPLARRLKAVVAESR